MDFNNRFDAEKPALNIVTRSAKDFPTVNDDSVVFVLDTSRHYKYSFFIKNKTINGVTYRIDIANIDSISGEIIGWHPLIVPTSIAGNSMVNIVNDCIADRVRLVVYNQVVNNNSTIDVFARLIPFVIN